MILDRLWRVRRGIMLTAVGILAGALRFVNLGYPRSLVFDELYYARGAYSLLHQGYEGHWHGANTAFENGDYSGLETQADKVVHPPLGKWIIAVGMKMFGPTPFGWRFSSAVIGTVTVVVVAIIAAHLFRSVLWGGVAGMFLAIDGEHIVQSRTALLDIFLTFFVVVAFGFFLLDRRRTKRRLTQKSVEVRERLGLDPAVPLPTFGPSSGVRWWRHAALISLGLACGIKWSGLYFAFFFIALSIVWDLVDRRSIGVAWPLRGTALRTVLPLAFAAVILVPATYVATWTSWFASDSSYDRHWAALHEDEGISWLPDSARSFIAYHQEMWRFHNGLTISHGVTHSYAANPWGFIIQLQPTAYFWEAPEPADFTTFDFAKRSGTTEDVDLSTESPIASDAVSPSGSDATEAVAVAPKKNPCAPAKCVSTITALGNPLIWWGAAVAFAYAGFRAFRRRDLLAMTVIVGTVAGWLPWTFYPDRVMFTFYSVAFSPWVVLTLTWALARIAQPPRLEGGWSRGGGLAVGGFIAATLVMSAFFWPVWTGQWIPYNYWLGHMWLGPLWI